MQEKKREKKNKQKSVQQRQQYFWVSQQWQGVQDQRDKKSRKKRI